jgi:hypothetical protein
MEDSERALGDTDDNTRTPSEGTIESSDRTKQVAWKSNAWLGNPEGIERFLTKRGKAFFSKEAECLGMGGNYLVQQAFNKHAKPEELTKKEVQFHLKLCSIFHGITKKKPRKIGWCVVQLSSRTTGTTNNAKHPTL